MPDKATITRITKYKSPDLTDEEIRRAVFVMASQKFRDTFPEGEQPTVKDLDLYVLRDGGLVARLEYEREESEER